MRNPLQIKGLQRKKEVHMHFLDWWSVGGSNPWPQDCEPCALPAELTPRATVILTDYIIQKIKNGRSGRI